MLVGDDQDLGGSGFRVDADDPAHETLGGSHVDVARSGDQIHRVQRDIGHAVREGADRTGAAHRVDLFDAEESARAQDDRVHLAVELGLRRRRDHDRAHARHLRGHDVHDHARRVHGLAARNVEPDTGHRLPALDDLGPRTERRHRGRGHLSLAGDAHARDRLLDRRADGRVERDDGSGDPRRVDADAVRLGAVEATGLLAQRRLTAVPDIGDERCGGLARDGDVDARTRDEIGEFGAGGVATAEVEGLNHGSTMLVASSDDAVGSQQSLELTVEIRRDRDRVRDLEHARVVAAHQSQPHLVVARVPDQHVIEL